MRRGGQREKGKDAERKFARLLRAKFEGVDVRRSSQAERAHEADVWTTGHAVLDRCWFEVTDARKPNPRKKLEQAERDVARGVAHHGPHDRLPIVVWHRLGERTTYVTMRLYTLLEIKADPNHAWDMVRGCNGLVTMELGEFLELVA